MFREESHRSRVARNDGKEVDTDKSGSLDLVEFLNLMTSSRGAGSLKNPKRSFSKPLTISTSTKTV